MRNFSISSFVLHVVGTLAAPAEKASKVKSQYAYNLADLGQTPFPNTVYELLIVSNGTVVAVFRQGPARVTQKHYEEFNWITEMAFGNRDKEHEFIKRMA
ncbi:hypothetical protein ColLi_13822 [Colletotrichum liriopes]|uniref:Uncharacterized protein n=1 Tax=Colletotrichum liriopes TaxID=708192 RepID=A0AA37M032_9PEZI|nr:hypothetical protein ColLi_13822 [Colletotrichum liriopes]